MGKAAQARERTAREKIAVQRAAERRRAAVRRRLMIMGGSLFVVAALVIGFVVVRAGQKPPAAAGSATNTQIAKEIGSVPATTFDAIGKGNATGLKAVSGPELTQDGKPEVLYMGGEYCPYCAAERWVIATALGRFGTLSAPKLIHSSPTDVYANTPTLSFAGSSYTSKYVAFSPVEWYGEAADPSTPFGHVYFQHPTTQEVALFNQYGGNSVPFVDIANRYVVPGAQYIPSDLAGLTWSQIAADLKNPSSTVAKDIDGAANVITAALCKVTNGQPGNVCSSAGVKAAAGSL
jgi:thiol-disulfide isomerase/thioredoxin